MTHFPLPVGSCVVETGWVGRMMHLHIQFINKRQKKRYSDLRSDIKEGLYWKIYLSMAPKQQKEKEIGVQKKIVKRRGTNSSLSALSGISTRSGFSLPISPLLCLGDKKNDYSQEEEYESETDKAMSPAEITKEKETRRAALRNTREKKRATGSKDKEKGKNKIASRVGEKVEKEHILSMNSMLQEQSELILNEESLYEMEERARIASEKRAEDQRRELASGSRDVQKYSQEKENVDEQENMEKKETKMTEEELIKKGMIPVHMPPASTEDEMSEKEEIEYEKAKSKEEMVDKKKEKRMEVKRIARKKDIVRSTSQRVLMENKKKMMKM